jgi:hypothetical protein
MKKINVSEIQEGDVFSEMSHYTFVGKNKDGFDFEHHGSNSKVTLTQQYVENLLQSANLYETEITVGKEDKVWTAKQIEKALQKGDVESGEVREGDIRVAGIRSIWENIHSKQVFTVCFQKADTKLSSKAYQEALSQQRKLFVEAIDKTRRAKKGVSAKAEELLKEIQENPILPTSPGDDRVLYGYKLQFDSRDGRYDCMDMAINQPRPVNINTIKWLIFDGVMYTVK